MDHTLALNSALADREAVFEQLFRDHHRSIYVYLCRLVGDHKQAEDLTQDTFVKAYRALGPAAGRRQLQSLALPHRDQHRPGLASPSPPHFLASTVRT